MGMGRFNPGCQCCEGFGQVIGETKRIDLRAAGQTTVWTNLRGSDGCGYGPSFAGTCVMLDSGEVTTNNINTGAKVEDLVDLGGGADNGLFQECEGTIGVRDSNTGEVYSVAPDGTFDTFSGNTGYNYWPMRIGDNLYTATQVGGALVSIYKTELGGATNLYYELWDADGWFDLYGMSSDGDKLYMLGNTDFTDFKIASLTIPTSPAYAELAAFTLPEFSEPSGFTLLDGALYFLDGDDTATKMYRYDIALDSLEVIVETSGSWSLFDNPGAGKLSIVQDGT